MTGAACASKPPTLTLTLALTLTLTLTLTRRGLPFEASIQGKLGQLEVDDQVAAVRHAIAEGLADPARVGIYGWSY